MEEGGPVRVDVGITLGTVPETSLPEGGEETRTCVKGRGSVNDALRIEETFR